MRLPHRLPAWGLTALFLLAPAVAGQGPPDLPPPDVPGPESLPGGPWNPQLVPPPTSAQDLLRDADEIIVSIGPAGSSLTLLHWLEGTQFYVATAMPNALHESSLAGQGSEVTVIYSGSPYMSGANPPTEALEPGADNVWDLIPLTLAAWGGTPAAAPAADAATPSEPPSACPTDSPSCPAPDARSAAPFEWAWRVALPPALAHPEAEDTQQNGTTALPESAPASDAGPADAATPPAPPRRAAPQAAQGSPAPEGPRRGDGSFIAASGLLAGAAGLLGILVRMFSRKTPEDERRGDPVRRRILELVAAHPGIHFSGICRHFAFGKGQAQHHLAILTREGHLVAMKAHGRVWYYRSPEEAVAFGDAALLVAHPTPRRILEEIQEHPGVSPTGLGRRLSLATGVLFFHLNKLLRLGLVERHRQGRASLLFVTQRGRSAREATPQEADLSARGGALAPETAVEATHGTGIV